MNNGCLFCKYGDIGLMRSNGYSDDKYIFCERVNKIIAVKEQCDTAVYKPNNTSNPVYEESIEEFEARVIRVAAELEMEHILKNQ